MFAEYYEVKWGRARAPGSVTLVGALWHCGLTRPQRPRLFTLTATDQSQCASLQTPQHTSVTVPHTTLLNAALLSSMSSRRPGTAIAP